MSMEDYDCGYSDGYDCGLSKDKDTSFLLLAARIDELKAHIAALEAALKPFADAADELEDDEHGTIWECSASHCITTRDLRNCKRLLDSSRAARAALEQKK